MKVRYIILLLVFVVSGAVHAADSEWVLAVKRES